MFLLLLLLLPLMLMLMLMLMLTPHAWHVEQQRGPSARAVQNPLRFNIKINSKHFAL